MAEIEIEYVPGEDEHILQCRGHVDPEAFCRAALDQELVEVEPTEVEHMYCRVVPDRSGKSGGYYCYSRRPGRGAFAVTVVGIGDSRVAQTRIEYVTTTWNPVTGCSPVSEGCQNCYARRLAQRLRGRCGYPEDEPFRVTLHPERLEEPRRWRKPRRVFVCSMGDLFHPDVPGWYINQVWLSMMNNSEHTYLVLTKRPERLLAWTRAAARAKAWPADEVWPWWIWVGVTGENQARADERIPILLQIPAAVRWVSCEPLLGPIDLHNYLWVHHHGVAAGYPVAWADKGKIRWVVAGAETGPGARTCDPEWAEWLRDQCQAAGVPFFWKRWKDGSRLLGGREWNEYPEVG